MKMLSFGEAAMRTGARRRAEDEDQDSGPVRLTYREALEVGIEALIEKGDEDERVAAAVKMIEAKVGKMRAREAKPLTKEHWCLCGDSKDPRFNFCQGCYAAFPDKVVQLFHTGTLKQQGAARKEMQEISRTRLRRDVSFGKSSKSRRRAHV